jgi:hypothetical protein
LTEDVTPFLGRGGVFSTGLGEIYDEKDIFFVGQRDSFDGLPFIG